MHRVRVIWGTWCTGKGWILFCNSSWKQFIKFILSAQTLLFIFGSAYIHVLYANHSRVMFFCLQGLVYQNFCVRNSRRIIITIRGAVLVLWRLINLSQTWYHYRTMVRQRIVASYPLIVQLTVIRMRLCGSIEWWRFFMSGGRKEVELQTV